MSQSQQTALYMILFRYAVGCDRSVRCDLVYVMIY